jgi:hypothetical protein
MTTATASCLPGWLVTRCDRNELGRVAGPEADRDQLANDSGRARNSDRSQSMWQSTK